MSYERLKPQLTITQEQLEELKKIVPEAFADGKINWQKLKEALGEYLEEEGAEAEHFGLFWPGKREARRMAAIPSKGTLVPVPGEGVDEETTRNIFIEGENLEVLKLLQKSYAGRIKMIYIDPPYNTGNDFVYEDDFREPMEEYLRRTGQVDEEGKPWTTNTRADGRFHSKWLSMMYPRLKLARSLLREDGVIWVSIDDNEVHNLRQIMNEVFGEENLVVQIAWQSRQSIQNDTDISVNHEYIVGYAKLRRQKDRRLKESNAEKWYQIPGFAAYPLPLDPSKFSNPDNDPRGPWKADPFDAPNIRPNLTYAIVNPNTLEKHWPPNGRCWRTDEESFKKLLADKRILFGKSGEARPQLKVFYEEKKHFGEVENSWFDGATHGTATHGTKQIQDLFDGIAIFESPKPTSLLISLLKISTRPGDLVLDFFAGSGTTGHAVFSLNEEFKESCRFILVQMPELCEDGSATLKAGYKNIAEICKERIRRTIKTLKNDGRNQKGLFKDKVLDFGFKVFKLATSSFKIWQDYDGTNLAELEANLDLFETPLVEGWKPENLLTEILLLEGFPLDSKIETLKDHKKNTVQRVTSEFCEHHLLVCLDKKIEQETIEHLKFEENDVFVCLDSALSDQDKMRLADVCKLKTI